MDMNMSDAGKTGQVTASSNQYAGMMLHSGFTETIIFQGWKTQYPGDFFGSCIALMLLAVSYEALKLFRYYLAGIRIKVKAAKTPSATASTQRIKMETDDPLQIYWHTFYFRRISTLKHVVQTILHTMQFALGYFLMLAFMISNYWICLSIIIGIGAGYFFFGVRDLNQRTNEECSS